MGGSQSSTSKLELFNQEPLGPLDPVADAEQIKFEQLLSILVLIELFGTHGFFGSCKKQDINLRSLTREFVRHRIQTVSILPEYVEKIKLLLPDRLVQDLHIPSIFSLDCDKEFKDNSEYCLAMAEEKIKFFKSLGKEEITDNIIKSVTSSYNIGRDQNELIEFLSADEKHLDIFSTAKFKKNKHLKTFESKIAYLKTLSKYDLRSEIDYMGLEKVLQGKLCSDTSFARIHIHWLIQNLTIEKFNNSIFSNSYCWETFEDKYSSVYKKMPNKTDNEVGEDDEVSLDDVEYNEDEDEEVGEVEKSNNSIASRLKSIEKSHQKKYYIEVYSKAHPEKAKYDYYLNFEDYWALYQLDPILVKEIIESTYLVDDYTFGEYKHSSWDFLNSLNPRVRQNIITKHNSDKKSIIKNRYGPIESLEDLVDIAIFCQFPPTFLRPENDGTKYYEENRQVLFELLESYGWDMNKLDYLNWDLIISYSLVRKV